MSTLALLSGERNCPKWWMKMSTEMWKQILFSTVQRHHEAKQIYMFYYCEYTKNHECLKMFDVQWGKEVQKCQIIKTGKLGNFNKSNISNIQYIHPAWTWSNDFTISHLIEISIYFYRAVLGLKILVILGPTAWKDINFSNLPCIFDKPGPVYGIQINESILRKVNLYKVWISYWPT